MKHNRYFLYLITVVFINNVCAQEWTCYVRTSGHGCAINQIQAVMDDARKTHLFGIEVDNNIPR